MRAIGARALERPRRKRGPGRGAGVGVRVRRRGQSPTANHAQCCHSTPPSLTLSLPLKTPRSCRGVLLSGKKPADIPHVATPRPHRNTPEIPPTLPLVER
ncbi:hypothetical protein E1J24_13625 [Xanthomonas hortorum pv. pelargonii]|uniref:Uncharacterized protein n=1 Tax=Xanthomonas hortorum pv. pelargonii TaxID=453602 RepID=A0AAW9ZUI1_9XANT|nr:hypothetical protein [Xanthomonas hortorum pv. pelargonii]